VGNGKTRRFGKVDGLMESLLKILPPTYMLRHATSSKQYTRS
jgi:hypothetical protein